jgi:hypothetical protein
MVHKVWLILERHEAAFWFTTFLSNEDFDLLLFLCRFMKDWGAEHCLPVCSVWRNIPL